MRTEIQFKLVCAKCGKVLSADSSSKHTRVYPRSASHQEASIAIVPCKICFEEAQRPLKYFKELIKISENG